VFGSLLLTTHYLYLMLKFAQIFFSFIYLFARLLELKN